jgi:hypothetical protein
MVRLFACTRAHPPPLRGASGCVRSRKPLLGRGPRDQSSGQKPRMSAPEALVCLAPLRFERARGREVGNLGIGFSPRLLLNRRLKLFLGVVLRCVFLLKHSRVVGHFFRKNEVWSH